MKSVKQIFLVALCTLCASCANDIPSGGKGGAGRSIDSLNSRAFDMRYRDIALSKAAAACALNLVEELAPDYHAARAQALNHLAYASYLTSRFDSTRFYIDRIRRIEADYKGRAVEEAITSITEARLYLRECRYAEAFTIYDSTLTIFKGPLRRLRHGGGKRYDWARSDYLIGNAVLDYYYRKTRLPVILRLLDEVERNPRLHIDTTQLSTLYYTYAGSYERAISDDVANFYSALDNVEKGLEVMENPARRSDYQLANLYQIAGSVISNEGTAGWLAGGDSVEIRRRLDRFRTKYLIGKYGWSETEARLPGLPLSLLLKVDSLFRLCDDPYQNMVSNLRLGDYHFAEGDTAASSSRYRQAVACDSIVSARGGSAGIWTGRLYNTLIQNAAGSDPAERLKQWHSIYVRQEEVIDENTKRDYNAQKERIEAEAFARRSLAFASFILVVCAVVTTLLYFLWKRNRQLHFMQKRLIEQKRMELLTYVVRGVSHELSQPLGSITQTLYDTFRDVAVLGEGREKLSDERYGEAVANIESDLRTIARGKDAISDLVRSFRNTIRENVVDPEADFNLSDKLEDIARVVRPSIKSNIDLRIDCPPDLTVRTFPLLFSQVVTNLISNADQHAFPDPGSTGDTIRIVCRESGRDLVVKCADNGTGIPEGELERLCQPFVSKKQTNLGLGLSLVKNIVEQYMNGSIAFSSDKGLTVTVLIPGCVIRKQ